MVAASIAGSLSDLSGRLARLGRHAEALSVAEEAAAIYRELALDQPDAFNPSLAGALDRLGGLLAELGRHEEAEAARNEAVALPATESLTDARRVTGAWSTARSLLRRPDASAADAWGHVRTTHESLKKSAAARGKDA